jgi:hypothetical protein
MYEPPLVVSRITRAVKPKLADPSLVTFTRSPSGGGVSSDPFLLAPFANKYNLSWGSDSPDRGGGTNEGGSGRKMGWVGSDGSGQNGHNGLAPEKP